MLLATSALTAILVKLVFGFERRRRVVLLNLPFLRLRAMIRLGCHTGDKAAEYRLHRIGGRLSRADSGQGLESLVQKVGYVIKNLGSTCYFVGNTLGFMG